MRAKEMWCSNLVFLIRFQYYFHRCEYEGMFVYVDRWEEARAVQWCARNFSSSLCNLERRERWYTIYSYDTNASKLLSVAWFFLLLRIIFSFFFLFNEMTESRLLLVFR